MLTLALFAGKTINDLVGQKLHEDVYSSIQGLKITFIYIALSKYLIHFVTQEVYYVLLKTNYIHVR